MMRASFFDNVVGESDLEPERDEEAPPPPPSQPAQETAVTLPDEQPHEHDVTDTVPEDGKCSDEAESESESESESDSDLSDYERDDEKYETEVLQGLRAQWQGPPFNFPPSVIEHRIANERRKRESLKSRWALRQRIT